MRATPAAGRVRPSSSVRDMAESAPMLTDATNTSAPNFVPKAGSPALTGGATPPADAFFDATATFRGAFGATNWAEGWAAFPAN